MLKPVKWLGSSPKCDANNSHKLNGVFYDAYLPGYRQWGLVCQECFDKLGCSLGQGKGQKYERRSDLSWIKTA
jgi:hypothetical protein